MNCVYFYYKNKTLSLGLDSACKKVTHRDDRFVTTLLTGLHRNTRYVFYHPYIHFYVLAKWKDWQLYR